jgi:undecaprenyl-diphosphatase
MPFSLFQIIILGLIQGATELLPVSSSAHVIVAEKLMGIDPVSPEATFLLIMLHTGTMLAVLVYFWRSWVRNYFSSAERSRIVVKQVILATAITGVIGLGLKYLIEKFFLAGSGSAEVESLFGNLPLIATGLAAVGILIIIAGRKYGRSAVDTAITTRTASWMGILQGLTLPFRGFSRSGSTISTALLLGTGRRQAEEFSFAMGVIVTPPLLAIELQRLMRFNAARTEPLHLIHLAGPGVIGMACSFFAGLMALRLLSRWLEGGQWRYFGVYCLGFAAFVFALAKAGL